MNIKIPSTCSNKFKKYFLNFFLKKYSLLNIQFIVHIYGIYLLRYYYHELLFVCRTSGSMIKVLVPTSNILAISTYPTFFIKKRT